MTRLRRIICWLFRHHTDPRIMAVDLKTGAELWLCKDCLESWVEYNLTGRKR